MFFSQYNTQNFLLLTKYEGRVRFNIIFKKSKFQLFYTVEPNLCLQDGLTNQKSRFFDY